MSRIHLILCAHRATPPLCNPIKCQGLDVNPHTAVIPAVVTCAQESPEETCGGQMFQRNSEAVTVLLLCVRQRIWLADRQQVHTGSSVWCKQTGEASCWANILSLTAWTSPSAGHPRSRSTARWTDMFMLSTYVLPPQAEVVWSKHRDRDTFW